MNEAIEVNENELEVTPVSSLSTGGMLVELNISVWTGRKKDKRASKQITDENGAKRGVANVSKKLLGDCDELITIQKLAGNTRNHTHYHLTMPWSDSGLRLLTTAAYFDYNEEMTAVQQEFFRLVEIFLDAYQWEITKARTALGDLFDESEYPSVDSLRGKFDFRINYMPMPTSGDWRIDIQNEALSELQEQYADFSQRQLNKAMGDVWQRVFDALTTLADRIDYGDHEKKKIFKQSTVDNLHDLIGLLDTFNITNDPNMSQMKVDLEQAMRGITPEALREDEHLRMATKKKLEAAKANLPTLM